MSLFARVMFYPSLSYNIMLSKCTSRLWYNWVDENVVIGALPFKSMTKQLTEVENVKAVLSMNESYELKLSNSPKEWKALGVDYLRLNTVDLFDTPSQDQLKSGVEFIQAHCNQGHSVYVHCKAGRTRSATVVMCYLMKVNKWSPEEAYAHLKKCRPHVWIREKQMDSILTFYKDMK